MLPISTRPKKVEKIANGWAVFGDGWAVHAPTKESALQAYEDRVKFYRELAKRPDVMRSQRQEDGKES